MAKKAVNQLLADQQQPYDTLLKSLLEGQEREMLPYFLPGADYLSTLNIPRDAQRADVAEEAGHFLLASAKLTGMIQQHIFASQDVPERFKCQILSFVRIQWPELFSGKNRLRDWTSKPELHPVTFLLEEEGVLISRLEIVWDVLTHVGETYLTYGLSGVFTYPAFRKQGYGLQLVQSAKAFIEQQAEADLVLFHSTLKGFYEQVGFEWTPSRELCKDQK